MYSIRNLMNKKISMQHLRSQMQQLAPMIYQQIFSNESFQNSDPGFQQFWKGDTINQAGNQARKSILF